MRKPVLKYLITLQTNSAKELNPKYRSEYLSYAKRALYHLSYILIAFSL